MTNTTLSSRTISPTALIDEVDVAAQAAAEIVERVVWGLDDRDKSVSTTAKGRLTKRSVPKVDVNVWLDQPGRGIPGVRSGADGHAIAPAWTDGQSVYVARSTFVAPPETVWEAQESAVQAGRRLPAAVSFLDLKALKGATYHELAHVLYSPRVGGYAATRLRDTERLRRAWNLLEDHRIETLFSSRYVGSIDYFTRIALNVVLRGNLDNEDATPDALLWLWGRKYLPFEIRTKVFDRFVAKFGEDLALRAVALIEEFLSTPHDVHTTQVAPRSAEKVAKVDRLVEVVTEFADILDFVQAQAITDGFPPIGDPGQGGHGAQAGGKAQAEADPIAPEQPPTTGGASAPGSGDDGADGADGADGSPANGDGASDGDAGADEERADEPGARGDGDGTDLVGTAERLGLRDRADHLGRPVRRRPHLRRPRAEHPDREPRLIHHREHGCEPFVRIANEPASGAIKLHHTGGRRFDAHFVFQRGGADGVARTARAVIIYDIFWYQKQRDTFWASRCIWQAREY